MKLNWTPNSFSDFAISVTSLLPVTVSGLPKSLLSEESLCQPRRGAERISPCSRNRTCTDNNYFLKRE